MAKILHFPEQRSNSISVWNELNELSAMLKTLDREIQELQQIRIGVAKNLERKLAEVAMHFHDVGSGTK